MANYKVEFNSDLEWKITLDGASTDNEEDTLKAAENANKSVGYLLAKIQDRRKAAGIEFLENADICIKEVAQATELINKTLERINKQVEKENANEEDTNVADEIEDTEETEFALQNE